MKKIGSFVLMAVMLLVSANTWAGQTRTAGNASQFEDAWTKAQDGDVIKLTNDITITKTLWLGTETMSDANPKSITLDLNGWILTNNQANLAYMFVLSHGELIVKTSEAGGKIIQNATNNQELFRVLGSTYKNINPKTAKSGYYTHLVIEEGVTVDAKVTNAIAIDEAGNTFKYPNSKYSGYYLVHKDFVLATADTKVPSSSYSTSVYRLEGKDKNGKTTYTYRGTANGVRIDIHGVVRGNKYAIKANGNLGAPSILSDGYIQNPTLAAEDAPGSGTYSIQDGDVNYAPFIHLHPSGDLRVPATSTKAKKNVSVYCSGYARWLIESTCVGPTAVYVKSGEVEIHDATIQSNYTGTYTAPSATSSGVTGEGSAIAVESNANYAGDISVTVSGDTHVSASNGYAIEESVTNADDTKVSSITISGGTFDGGQVPDPENPGETTQGTITITAKTAENETTTITVTGGQISGSANDENNANIGGESLQKFLTEIQEEDTHTSTIVNGTSTTTVISSGTSPSKATTVAGVDGRSVKWQNATGITTAQKETLVADLSLKELDITQTAYTQTLTIQTGVTLSVERVVLGTKAQIIVQPGAKFLVTGEQGITANLADNIVLQSSETAQALFLVDPTVQGSRQPMATVKMTVTSAGKDGGDYSWQRFAMPVSELKTAWSKTPNVGTYLYGWDYENDDWLMLPGGSTAMTPWQGYTLTHDEAIGTKVVYSFAGEMAGGNANAGLKFKAAGFNFFGNSYTGSIDAKTLVQGLTSANVYKTIYMWDPANQSYGAVTLSRLVANKDLEDWEKDVQSMQTFLLILTGANTATQTVNYSTAVWNNPRFGHDVASAAPARINANDADDDEAYMKIVITGENGKSDYVTFTKNANLSDAFEDGFDAVKFMNNNHLNVYSKMGEENMTSVASDNLVGKKLSMNTHNDLYYTLSFKNVEGESYAIKDNETNVVTPIEEGNIYTFAAQPNATIEGRFEIISIAEVATAVDNTATDKNARGIYTMLGQYVGEDYNALPAGVYVVNGAKIVK